VSGLVTIVALGIPGVRLIAGEGSPVGGQAPVTAVPSRVVTVREPVTSVNVESYGSNISVVGGSGRDTRVAESISYSEPDGEPAVTVSVSDGRLTLAAPSCAVSNCSVGFTVTVPADVTVTATSDGGPVAVSGVARANIGSAGGPVRATEIPGPLAVQTGGGSLVLDGVGGPLHADTGGGPLMGRNVAAATATVTTEGGDAYIDFTGPVDKTTVTTGGGAAQLQFTAAPRSVVVSTDGGPAFLAVPGGPYALTTDSNGGPQLVGIATNPAAPSSITVTSDGGPLQVEPATAGVPKLPLPPVPEVPPSPKV
jgi:hypothetical protein